MTQLCAAPHQRKEAIPMVRVTEASPVAASPATGPQKQSVKVPRVARPNRLSRVVIPSKTFKTSAAGVGLGAATATKADMDHALSAQVHNCCSAPASQTPCTFASRGSVRPFQALAEVQPLLSGVPSPLKPEAAARLFLRFGVGLAPPALLVVTSPACSCGVLV